MPSFRPRMLEVLRSASEIARAAIRVGWHYGRSPLPEAVSLLKTTRARAASDPRLALALLERLLPLLPPYGSGRCMKRSLLLLDLWSRAGLAPRIHFGIRSKDGAREGHAWVTTRETGVATYRPPDVLEAWSA